MRPIQQNGPPDTRMSKHRIVANSMSILTYMLPNTMKCTFPYTQVCVLVSLLMCFSYDVIAQNCTYNETGLTPIPDLENGLYLGFQGGLYFGSNNKPLRRFDALNGAISRITPRNSVGLPDDVGSIVLLSIGASNPKTEFESFQTISSSYGMMNSYLKLVNDSQGGKGLQKIIDPADNCWQFVMNQLPAGFYPVVIKSNNTIVGIKIMSVGSL